MSHKFSWKRKVNKAVKCVKVNRILRYCRKKKEIDFIVNKKKRYNKVCHMIRNHEAGKYYAKWQSASMFIAA